MKTHIFVPTIDGHRSKKGIDILFHVSFPMSQGIAGVIANFLKLIFIIWMLKVLTLYKYIVEKSTKNKEKQIIFIS